MKLKYHVLFQLHSALRRFDGKILSKIPTHAGLCVVRFRIEEQFYEDVKDIIYDLTAGLIKPTVKRKNDLF